MTTTPLVCFTSVLVGNIELCAKEPVALYKIVILPKFANRYISSSPDRKRYGLSRIGIPCTPAVDENGCKGLIECDCSRRRFLFSPLSGSFQIKDSREREGRWVSTDRPFIPHYQSGRIPPLRNKSRRRGHLCPGGGICVVFRGRGTPRAPERYDGGGSSSSSSGGG